MPTSKRPRTLAEMYQGEVNRVHAAFMEHIVNDHEACGGSCLVLEVYAEAHAKFKAKAALPSVDARMYADWPVEGSAES